MLLSITWAGIGALGQRLAPIADPLAAGMPLDGEHAGSVVELLANLFSDAPPAAARAILASGLVSDLDTRQVLGQGLTSGLLLGSGRRRRGSECFQLGLDGGDGGIHHLVQQADLKDVELFAALAEGVTEPTLSCGCRAG